MTVDTHSPWVLLTSRMTSSNPRQERRASAGTDDLSQLRPDLPRRPQGGRDLNDVQVDDDLLGVPHPAR
ncbi:hypothetical protein, partial [Streptomyces sp. NRRL S-340]|uniref:hypothetical protein n=1 Tax=Streptomyces sp. NRRL S-340 TaxID=1463901 RepID=UPI001F468A68